MIIIIMCSYIALVSIVNDAHSAVIITSTYRIYPISAAIYIARQADHLFQPSSSPFNTWGERSNWGKVPCLKTQRVYSSVTWTHNLLIMSPVLYPLCHTRSLWYKLKNRYVPWTGPKIQTIAQQSHHKNVTKHKSPLLQIYFNILWLCFL